MLCFVSLIPYPFVVFSSLASFVHNAKMLSLLSLLSFLTLASAAALTNTATATAPPTNVNTAIATGPAANSAAASASLAPAESAAAVSDAAAAVSGAAYASATGPVVDECGPKIPDPNVEDSCYSPVQRVDTPSAYGVLCQNDTISTPLNVTSCGELIPIMCAQEWQQPGQWLWISNNECSLGSFLSPYNGSAQWPSAIDCELLIYASMVNECAYSGIPYNIASVNLKELPQNIGQGSNQVIGTGAAVNVGYGSYIVADRQLRNLSDASSCDPVPYWKAPPTPVACASGKGGAVLGAIEIPLPVSLGGPGGQVVVPTSPSM